MSNTINFGELVLEDGAIVTSQKTTTRKKAAAAPVFECVASSGADFAIRRTTATTSKMLVMLVSQEQYYIKNEKSSELIALSEKSLDSFFQGLGEDSIHIGCSWIAQFNNSKEAREALATIVRVLGFKQAATNGLMSFERHFDRYGNHNWRGATEEITNIALHTETCAPLVKHIGAVSAGLNSQQKTFLSRNVCFIMAAFNAYGLDRTRELVDRLVTSAAFASIGSQETRSIANLAALAELLAIVPTRAGITTYTNAVWQEAHGKPITFQFDKFCGYLFEQSAREGFLDLGSWLLNWKDTLLLQLYVSGKITDKYPANLLTTHQILSTEAAHMKKTIDEEAWRKAEAKMAELDFFPESDDYHIIHPATPQDMRDEAVAQNNCLAGYIGKVLSGHCMIFFARRTDAPNKSLLTIEVSSNLQLMQVKARFNNEADDESMAFVTRWCREKGISLGMYKNRANALMAA